MTKEARSFRLESEALESLQRLSDKWNVSQAVVLEMLIREAEREGRELRAVAPEKVPS